MAGAKIFYAKPSNETVVVHPEVATAVATA